MWNWRENIDFETATNRVARAKLLLPLICLSFFSSFITHHSSLLYDGVARGRFFLPLINRSFFSSFIIHHSSFIIALRLAIKRAFMLQKE